MKALYLTMKMLASSQNKQRVGAKKRPANDFKGLVRKDIDSSHAALLKLSVITNLPVSHDVTTCFPWQKTSSPPQLNRPPRKIGAATTLFLVFLTIPFISHTHTSARSLNRQRGTSLAMGTFSTLSGQTSWYLGPLIKRVAA